MANFIRPKKPNYDRGRIVFHSDDGRIFDYTQYVPRIRSALYKHDQFKRHRGIVFCPAVNTGYVDDGFHETVGLDMITWDMIKEIDNEGGEILSHGKYHLFLDYSNPSESLSAGSTVIKYTRSEARPREGYTYFIREGNKIDYYTVVSYTHEAEGVKEMNITPPLTNSYSVSAQIQLTDESLHNLLGGLVDQADEHGITVKNHICAWYKRSPESLVVLKQYFDSVITTVERETELPQYTDIWNMHRAKDLRSYSLEECDAVLDDIIGKDSVCFMQMHGIGQAQMNRNLEYILEQALLRGVRIVTHSQALRFIKSKQ